MFILAFKNARENPSSSYVVSKLYMPSEIKGESRFEKEKMKNETVLRQKKRWGSKSLLIKVTSRVSLYMVIKGKF